MHLAVLLAEVLVVAHNAESRIVLVDPATLQTVARFPSGPGPHEIAVSTDQRWAYVADAGAPDAPGKSVTVIDLVRREVAATWDVGAHGQPHDLRPSRDGSLLWVGLAPQRKVVELDTADGSVVRAYDLELDGGWMLTASPDDRRVYVAHLEGGGVTAIEREGGKTAVHRTAPGEMGMEVSPDGAELWVANVEQARITVLDARSHRELASFASGCKRPTRIRFTPDGARVLVPCSESKSLVVFDRKRRAPIASVALPAAPKILSVAPDGKRAVLTAPAAGLGMIVDLAARRVTGTFPAGQRPDGVAWAGDPRPPRGRLGFVINEADLIPEGIAHDAATGTFYVGSTYKRKVVAVGADGAPRDFTTEGQDGLYGVVGMKVDARRRALWLAASDAGDDMPMRGEAGPRGRSGVWQYDLGTGKLIRRWLIGGGTEQHFLNDLDLDARGDVYVTDSLAGAVYRIRDAGGELEPFVPPGGLTWPNGLAFSDDERTLYVAVRGGIAAIDVATRRTAPVELPAPARADGLYFHRGGLVAVQPWGRGRVVERLELAPGGRRVSATHVLEADHPELSQPTTGVVVGEELFYLANAQLQLFRRLRRPDGSFPMASLRPVVVLRLPL